MRTVLKNNDEVAHVWAQQTQYQGSASNMFFDGKSIYSYGRHFEIARFITDDIVFFTTKNYSNSTAKHKSKVWRAISHKTVFTVDSFVHGGDVDGYIKRIDKALTEAVRARTLAQYKFDYVRGLESEFRSYLDIFSKGVFRKSISKFDKKKAIERAVLLGQIEINQYQQFRYVDPDSRTYFLISADFCTQCQRSRSLLKGE